VQPTATTIPDAARAYIAAGLCALPAKRAEKRPTIAWKQYQGRLPTQAEIDAWFSNRPDAICILTGKISGNLEMIDFDNGGELFDAWSSRIPPDLLQRLVIEETQSGGWHVIYRCQTEVCGSLKLAQRKEGGKVFTLIETRGQGGLFLCAPTAGYELMQGDLTAPPILTEDQRDALLQAAWELNEYAPPVVNGPKAAPDGGHTATLSAHSANKSPSLAHQANNPPTLAHDADRPGDDFNSRGDVRAVLKNHDWTCTKGGENEYWRRPGKTSGTSATLKERVFYVFSSNAAPFEPNEAYSPFAVYAILEHGGDYEQAARSLRDLGYGADNPPDLPTDVDVSGIVDAEAGDDDIKPSVLTTVDPGPFPEDLFDVPGFIGGVIEHTLSIAHRHQPILALAGAIMLQAVLAARKVRDDRGNRTNLYAIGIALSSAGKDKPREVNEKILELADVNLLGNEEVTSDAAILTAVEARPAVLFQFDEFGRFLRTMGDPRKSPNLYSAVTTFMRLFSSANRTYRGKGYADAKRNKTIIQPCAGIYGTSTPRAMYESLSREGIEDGFVGRLIFFETLTRPPRIRHDDIEPPEHLIETARWWDAYSPEGGNIERVHPKPRLIEATDEANEVFDALAGLSDSEMEKDETYAPIWGRAEEKACRLALTYACSKNKEDPIIDVDAVRWACKLSEYTTRRTVFTASQWISEGLFDARQKRVLRDIRFAGSVSKSELCLRTQYLTPKDRNEVIDNLVQTGLIRIVNVPTKGRTRTEYQAV